MMKRKILVGALIAIFFAAGFYGKTISSKPLPLPAGHYVMSGVPFTSQAPNGDWKDPRQQNGCEEAAALMAVSWAQGKTFTKDEALKKITGISDWELKKYKEFHDTSAKDTLDRVIKGYFNFKNAELKNNATIADLVNELKLGHVIIAPMNGQLMRNPYFTAPGPTTHMVVITGYDSAKRIFITNDPGTRRGQNYSYDVDVFYNAMRDYPTGNHVAIKKIEKNIIIIKK